MDISLVVPDRQGHVADLGEVKVGVVLVVVGGDPAHPHTADLLARKHPHRVIVL